MNENFRKHTTVTGYKLDMVDVTFEANDFGREHPALMEVVRDVLFNQEAEPRADLTIEQFAALDDRFFGVDWQKARYVAENIACLWAAEHLVGWGEGYRSDDGFDYLNAALDNARFLTNIDLTEEEFLKWWNATPEGDDDADILFGATDGEIRFMMFPHRCMAYLGEV
jgi:hypothetical protein